MEDRTIVTIPDLFKCFLTQQPRSNKGYQAAKFESERWLAKSVISVVRYLDQTAALRPNRTDQNMRLRSQYEQKGQRLRFLLFHLHRGPVIQALERLGADLVILSNDILSYRKEEGEGCPFNMTAVCRLAGHSAQEAFDILGSLLEQRYIQWDQAIHHLPSWGANIDGEVRRYIDGIQNVVQANISWSFRSERYLGKNALEVRRTRKIDVMTIPPYLKILNTRLSLLD